MTQMERRCRDNLSQLGRTLRDRAHDPSWDVDLLLREIGVVSRDWLRVLENERMESPPTTPIPGGNRNA